METSVVAKDPLVGRVLAGKFRIETYVGGGAMGSVYRARQMALDKVVAIKVLKAELVKSRDFAVRFKREAKAAAGIDHPNSVRIIDFGEEPDGLLYMAMEYLSGQDLLALINKSWPLGDEEIVGILTQVLSALSRAHDAGVVHRDLKPENVMILDTQDDEGRAIVKVCDFGIAKLVTRDQNREGGALTGALTNVGVVLGTPEYMSPEQGRGEELDARSDIYSVGVMLYQLLTRLLPFESETALGLVFKHATEPLRPPIEVIPTVNPNLDAVVRRAMEKRRDDRFANAREMRTALARAIDPNAVEARITGNGSGQRLVQPGVDRHSSDSMGTIATAETETALETVTAREQPALTTDPGRQRARKRVFAMAGIGLGIAVLLLVGFVARSRGGVAGPRADDSASPRLDTAAAAANRPPADPAQATMPLPSLATSADPVPSSTASAAGNRFGKPGMTAPLRPNGNASASAQPPTTAAPPTVAPPPPTPAVVPPLVDTGPKKPQLDPTDPWKK